MNMIEEVILEYLNKRLNVAAYMEMPERNQKQFVLIEKTGSSIENHIHCAVFALQSYAESMHQAAVLNEDLKIIMDEIIAYTDISKAKLNSDYNYTDTTKKQYRYQAIYEIYY